MIATTVTGQEACYKWLQNLVTRPIAVLRHSRSVSGNPAPDTEGIRPWLLHFFIGHALSLAVLQGFNPFQQQTGDLAQDL